MKSFFRMAAAVMLAVGLVPPAGAEELLLNGTLTAPVKPLTQEESSAASLGGNLRRVVMGCRDRCAAHARRHADFSLASALGCRERGASPLMTVRGC